MQVTGKYTSVRHALAKEEGKLTAGDLAKVLRKELKKDIKKNDILEVYKLIFGCEPEWHHSGFYKSQNGKRRMGRTFFFSEEEKTILLANWENIVQREEFIKQKKDNFLIEKTAERFIRQANKPEFGHIDYEEMHGKYGWLEANYRYNLPVFYSGWKFKNEEDLKEFNKLFS